MWLPSSPVLPTRHTRTRPSAHARTRYELVGDLASYRDVAQWLSEIARMPINIERVDRDTAVQRQVQSGRLRDAYGCDALARMISYYEEQYVLIRLNSILSVKTTHNTHIQNYLPSGLTGSLNTLRWLLGREPLSVKRYIAREARI